MASCMHHPWRTPGRDQPFIDRRTLLSCIANLTCNLRCKNKVRLTLSAIFLSQLHNRTLSPGIHYLSHNAWQCAENGYGRMWLTIEVQSNKNHGRSLWRYGSTGMYPAVEHGRQLQSLGQFINTRGDGRIKEMCRTVCNTLLAYLAAC